MGPPRPRITVIGLGPAGAPFLSHAAVTAIGEAACAYARTTRHPAAEGLEGITGLDHLYESADTFEEVYRAIVEELVASAVRHAPEAIVYAVPGSPLIGERTVELLRDDERVDLTVVPSLSFCDLAWERLGIDPLREGVRLVDAADFAAAGATEMGPLLVGQCWSPQILSDIKLAAPAGDDAELPDVTLLHHLGLDDEQVVTVGWWELDRTLAPDHLTSLYIPAFPGGAAVQWEMDRLEALMRTLRANCPWDQAQTHASLMPHLVEESYEVLDAIAAAGGPGADDDAFTHLEEELGDLLFQIVFHACLAEEEGHFNLADVARGVHDKLVHRHPHVFGEVAADTAAQVVTNWEAIKKAEKGRTSVTEGIPSQLPALMLATKLQRKASSVGLDSEETGELTAEVLAEVAHLAAGTGVADADAPLSADAEAQERLVGQLLFDVADLARRLGVDAEQALRTRALQLRAAIVAAESAGVPEAQAGAD